MDITREPYITIKGDLKLPYVVVKGKYVLDGKILVIPVQGNGDVYVNASK